MLFYCIEIPVSNILIFDTGKSQSKCSEKGSLHLMCKATILNRINTFPEIDLEVFTKPDGFVDIQNKRNTHIHKVHYGCGGIYDDNDSLLFYILMIMAFQYFSRLKVSCSL